jgi:hypothetical protein
MKKTLLIFALATQLILTSACNIIPDLSSSSSVKNLDDETERKQMLEMNAFREEWKAMRPALTNLVALESDLQYMLSNIDKSDDKLMNSTTLQLSLEQEEEVAAYETMMFSEKDDITSGFTNESEELEKLSKVPLFADAALLDSLRASADEMVTNIPLKNSEDPTQAEKSKVVEVRSDEVQSSGIEVAATAPVAEYLLDEDMTFETRANRIVGAIASDNVSNAVAAQNKDRERQPVDTSKFNNTFLQQPEKSAKFSTQQETISDSTNRNANKTSSQLQEQNKQTKDKFSNVNVSELTNPRNIVGTVNNYNVANPTSKNLKFNNSCTMTKSTVGDGYALHLASYRSLDNALKGWESLSNTYSKELCGLLALTEKVTVNNRQFFSLRAGGFETKDMADNACIQLTNKNQYCRSIRFTGDMLP